MPLARIQRTLSSLPLASVSIRDTLGQPARIYADALGRLPVDNLGTTRTSSTGLLDIYVDDSKTYNLEFSVNGVVLERVNGVDPQGVVELQNPSPVPGAVTITGTTATVTAFNVDMFAFQGGTITLPSDGTWYVGVEMWSGLLRTLPRLGHTGWIPVARCDVNAGTVTVSHIPLTMPKCRIPRTMAKVLAGQPINVVVMGSSLTEGTSTTYWSGMVFGAGAVDKYKIPTAVTLQNIGLGGTPNMYQLAQLGNGVRVVGTNFSDGTYPLLFKGPPNGRSPFFNDVDLVVIGVLANGGDYRLSCLEPIIRNLRKLGEEVVVTTDNPQNPTETYAGMAAAPLHIDGPELMRIADLYGCEIADTSAYVVDASIRHGLATVYRDAIHMFAAEPAGPSAIPSCGYEVWARAVRSTLPVSYTLTPPVATSRTFNWDTDGNVEGAVPQTPYGSVAASGGTLVVSKNSALSGQWGGRLPVSPRTIRAGDTFTVTGTLVSKSAGVGVIQVGLQGGGGGWGSDVSGISTPGQFSITLTAARDGANQFLFFGTPNEAGLGDQFVLDNVVETVLNLSNGVVGNPVPQRQAEIVPLPPSRIVADIKTPGDAFVILPAEEHHRALSTAFAGTLSAHPNGAASFARRFNSQTSPTQDLLTLTTGQYASLACIGMLSAALILYSSVGDGTCTFELYSNNVLVKSMSYTPAVTREVYFPLMTPTEMVGTAGTLNNPAYEIRVTSGALKIAALVALTPEQEFLSADMADRIGTWTRTVGGSPNMSGLATDTLNDYMMFRCPTNARRVVWFCSAKPNSKPINTWSGRASSLALATVGVNHARCRGGHVGPGETHVIQCAEALGGGGDTTNGFALHVGAIVLVYDR